LRYLLESLKRINNISKTPASSHTGSWIQDTLSLISGNEVDNPHFILFLYISTLADHVNSPEILASYILYNETEKALDLLEINEMVVKTIELITAY
jgi:hypothetical protein